MTTYSNAVEDALNHIHNAGILIPRPSEVRHHLEHHPHVLGHINVLISLADALHSIGEPSLELYSDPEWQDKHLDIYIRQDPYQENIMQDLDDLRDRLLAIDPAFLDTIFVTTDFRKPKVARRGL